MKTMTTVVLFVLAMPAHSAAHRLDEYLQAARISMGRNRIALEIDLTPGVNVAPAIVALLDRDGDGTISRSEAGAYGESVLREVALELDGRAVPLTLTAVEIPSRDDMSDGMGTIQLRASASSLYVRTGRHQLHFRNNHRPAGSVYLANALLPEDTGVAVLSQARDPRQQSILVEYEVSPWTTVLWLVVAGLVACGFSRKLRFSDLRNRIGSSA
jgi:hypothetical protein